jgi:hypothetical protein
MCQQTQVHGVQRWRQRHVQQLRGYWPEGTWTGGPGRAGLGDSSEQQRCHFLALSGEVSTSVQQAERKPVRLLHLPLLASIVFGLARNEIHWQWWAGANKLRCVWMLYSIMNVLELQRARVCDQQQHTWPAVSPDNTFCSTHSFGVLMV